MFEGTSTNYVIWNFFKVANALSRVGRVMGEIQASPGMLNVRLTGGGVDLQGTILADD